MEIRNSFDLFLNPEDRVVFKETCLKAKIAYDLLSATNYLLGGTSSRINTQDVRQCISRNPYPPLEEIWNLHFCQLLTVETYVTKLDAKKLNDFKVAMCELCLHDSMGDKSKEFVQTGMLSFFVGNAFKDYSSEGEKISESILNDVLQGVFTLNKENVVKSSRTLLSIWNCGTLEKSVLLKFSMHALNLFTKTSFATVVDAFSVQENCYNNDDPFHMTAVMQKIIQELDSNSVENVLFDVLLDGATNWKNYIVLIHAFVTTHSESYAILSKRIAELLKKSLQTSNECTFQKAILIGRQLLLALNPENLFPAAYKQWFLTQFSDCPLLKNPQTFNFFLQVLSNLIPSERNLEILKVGLERLFPVAGECQAVYADYRALLKTRINDLEPHVKPQDVIERLLSAYEETGRIPSYVLEASLMRKHYFLNEFLPVLLAPRVIPASPDAREKFIEELDKAGKIPGQMLLKYKATCLQERQRLFSGKE